MRRRILPSGWLGSWAGRHALPLAYGKEEVFVIRGEGDLRTELSAVAPLAIAPDDLEVLEAGGVRAEL